MPIISYPSPRVSQLDASLLDDELFSLLKQQLSDAFSLISTKPWSYNSHPELWSLILKLVMFKLTTFNTGSSYGFKLQNLKLSNKNSSSVIGSRTRYLLLGTILGEYFVKKIQSYLFAHEMSRDEPRNIYEKMKKLLLRYKTGIIKVTGDTIQVLELLNFVSFLVVGRYPSLIYRFLGISVTPIVADLLKFNGTKVNFEFQNRQLVWNVMTEFLVFILPLLQLRKLRRMARSLLPKNSDDQQHYGYSEKPVRTKFSSLPPSQCAMCIETTEARGIKATGSQITNACVTNCGHIYCYVCLAARFNAIENGNEQAEGCPRCRSKITSFSQYGNSDGDVDQDAIIVKYETVKSEDEKEAEEVFDDAHETSSHDTANEVSVKPPVHSGGLNLDQSDYSENEDLEEEGLYSDDFVSDEDEDDDFMDEAMS